MTNRFQPIKSIRGDTIKAEDLRASILQAAVQGRLVPQDPNDEPAEELVKRIRAEKQRLIREGKIKKERNVSEIHRRDGHWYETIDGKNETCIDEEIPFDIPDNWTWCRLGSLLQFVSDGTHRTPHYVNRGVPFISVKDISKGFIDFSDTKFISMDEHLELTKRTNPQKGDILLCRIGTLGKAIVIDTDAEFSIFVSLGLLRPVMSYMGNYIIFCINSPVGSSWIDSVKIGGGTHTFKINLGDIPGFLLPVPPLSEQARIIEKINSILPLIDSYGLLESEYTSLVNSIPDDLRISILQAAVQGRLVPQDPNDEPAEELVKRIRAEKQRLIREGKIKKERNVSEIHRRDGHWYETIDGKDEMCIDDEIPFEIPDSWTWCRGSTCFSKMESRHPDSDYFDYIDIDAIDNNHCVVTSPKRILASQAPSRASRAVHEGDVLFSMVRPYLRNIAIIDRSLQDSIASTGFYVCSPYPYLHSRFLFWMLISNYVIDGLTEFMKGDNSPSIKNSDIESFLFVIPPINEQKRIVEKIDSLTPLIERYSKVTSQFTSLPYDSKPKEATE